MILEIVLITLGTSIALKVDDWAKGIEQESIRQQYLVDYKEEVNNDITF